MSTRVVALDPGTRRIGVAVSNSSRSLAFPRPAIDAGEGAIASILEVIAETGATLVVIGRPTSLAGRDTASSLQADQFVNALAGSVDGVDFVAFDERLTTQSARRQMREAGRSDKQQRADIDSEAAVILLQNFLDATTT